MVGGLFDHFYFNLTFIHIVALYWLAMGLGMVGVLLVKEQMDEQAGSDSLSSPHFRH
jgi:hypothetical protein